MDADLHIFKKRLRTSGGGKKNKEINLWDKRSKQRQRLRGNRDNGNNKNSYNNSIKEANQDGEKARKRRKDNREERRKGKEEKEVVFMQLFEIAPTYMSAMEERILPLGEIG